MNRTAALDPLRLPLHDIRLIEASAGTGKTWTIAALYLRLVLGHTESGVPLLPPQILVVTFTKAATAELRERIRARLGQAAEAFRGQVTDDDYLAGLIADYPDPEARARAARQCCLRSSPKALALPPLHRTRPQTSPISVVLPAPLGPSSAKISPLAIVRSVGCKATAPPARAM